MSSCALLILSCDHYRDLWPASLALFERYWPDCPFPMHLGSDTVPGGGGRVTSIVAGPGLAWSDATRVIVSQIETKYVLLMLDDFFLTGRVSTGDIEKYWGELERRGAAYLRLVPVPPPTVPLARGSGLGEHKRGSPYRASLQAAFWKREALLSLLVPGESPWKFETAGSRRSQEIAAPFLSVVRPAIHYVDVLERGKWLPRGIALCRKERLPVDLGVRPSISVRDRVRRAHTRSVGAALGCLPDGVRQMLRRIRGG